MQLLVLVKHAVTAARWLGRAVAPLVWVRGLGGGGGGVSGVGFCLGGKELGNSFLGG